MITLITGHTGSGKTAYAVNFILDALNQDDKKVYTNISVNIIDNNLSYFDDVAFKQLFEDFAKTMQDNPNQEKAKEILKKSKYVNSLFVLDEVHFMGFRENNPYLNDFLTIHRHMGIDLILITQTPKNIWTKHLDLVHIHILALPSSNRLMPNALQYKIFEPYGSKDFQLKLFKPPKELFNLYKSGKKEFRINKLVVKVLLLFFVIFALLSYAYYSFKSLYGTSAEQNPISSHSNVSKVRAATNVAVGSIPEQNSTSYVNSEFDISDNFVFYTTVPKDAIYCETSKLYFFRNGKKGYKKGFRCLIRVSPHSN